VNYRQAVRLGDASLEFIALFEGLKLSSTPFDAPLEHEDQKKMDGLDMSDSMGSMSMGDGVPGLFYMQQMYWKVVGAAIAFAFAVNMFHKALALQR
jgi:hypothetical protein